MEVLFVLLILACAAAALLAYRASQRLERQTGLAFVRVIHSDTSDWRALDQPLFSSRYQLAGKPDYIVRDQSGMLVPVEVKPDRHAAEPYRGDLLQLAAYCLLIQETYAARPAYGLLKYHDALFRVEFTTALSAELEALLDEMRQAMGEDEVARSHSEVRRCAMCSYRAACDQRLN